MAFLLASISPLSAVAAISVALLGEFWNAAVFPYGTIPGAPYDAERSATRGFEEFDKVARRVNQEDLLASWTGHDVVPEPCSLLLQALDFRRQVVDEKVYAIPSAWTWLLSISHWTAGGTRRAAQEEPQRAASHIREGRSVV